VKNQQIFGLLQLFDIVYWVKIKQNDKNADEHAEMHKKNNKKPETQKRQLSEKHKNINKKHNLKPKN
jgi:hypothetical protein